MFESARIQNGTIFNRIWLDSFNNQIAMNENELVATLCEQTMNGLSQWMIYCCNLLKDYYIYIKSMSKRCYTVFGSCLYKYVTFG